MRHRTVPASRLAYTPGANARAVKIRLRIDRLTVVGYSRTDQERFAESLRATLSELAGRTGAGEWGKAQGLTLERLDAGRLPAGSSPETAARQMAKRILGGLTAGRDRKNAEAQSGEENHA